jgi:hypothetical protein
MSSSHGLQALAVGPCSALRARTVHMRSACWEPSAHAFSSSGSSLACDERRLCRFFPGRFRNVCVKFDIFVCSSCKSALQASSPIGPYHYGSHPLTRSVQLHRPLYHKHACTHMDAARERQLWFSQEHGMFFGFAGILVPHQGGWHVHVYSRRDRPTPVGHTSPTHSTGFRRCRRCSHAWNRVAGTGPLWFWAPCCALLVAWHHSLACTHVRSEPAARARSVGHMQPPPSCGPE